MQFFDFMISEWIFDWIKMIYAKEKQFSFYSFLQGSQGQTITLSSLPQSAIVSSSGSTLLIQPSQVKISYNISITEQLWTFIGRRAKFNGFLHSNEHPERTYLYLVRKFDAEWQKYGTFLLNKVSQEWLEKMLVMKVDLLFGYSNKNFGFRKIALYLASKIDFEIWKCLIFYDTASSCLTRYKKILSVCSFCV